LPCVFTSDVKCLNAVVLTGSMSSSGEFLRTKPLTPGWH